MLFSVVVRVKLENNYYKMLNYIFVRFLEIELLILYRRD